MMALLTADPTSLALADPAVPLWVVQLLKVLVIFVGLLTTAALTTLAERKVSAWIQWRIGPNRVGPFGLMQPLADGIKFMAKEEVIPDSANRALFRLAPAMSAMPAMLSIAVIPFAGTLTILGHETTLSITDLDISALYVVAVGGLGVFGVILGGWASNSKYSLMGALRASAQMVSYELSLILALMTTVVLAGSLDLRQIVLDQGAYPWGWNCFRAPLAFVIFVIATFAETNRHPFDFAECEPELVAGFHTEYSSFKFALFFLGAYCAMIVMASLTTTFFLGGPTVPFWADAPWWVQLPAFALKTGFFLFLFLWVRWTLPRFRFDQLMGLSWKVMLPAAILNIFIYGAFVSLV